MSNFDWLVGQYHLDERLLYKTTRVVVCRVSFSCNRWAPAGGGSNSSPHGPDSGLPTSHSFKMKMLLYELLVHHGHGESIKTDL